MEISKPRRRQLTLFVDNMDSENIENIRKHYNIKQYDLIKAHVTLCREHEIDELEAIKKNIQNNYFGSLQLGFGPVERFDGGEGVYMPAIFNVDTFYLWRKIILQGIIQSPGLHQPHITLMHPSNSTCSDQIFSAIRETALPAMLTFRKISLIEQVIGEKWTVLEEYNI